MISKNECPKKGGVFVWDIEKIDNNERMENKFTIFIVRVKVLVPPGGKSPRITIREGLVYTVESECLAKTYITFGSG